MLENLIVPKISILIPVYNVEKYVERCILSVLNQTMLEGVEVIIVNDCTPDNSMEVINKTLQNSVHLRSEISIKIINHETNKGIAFTRDEALKYATGEYILQIDSDDYLAADMIEKMYNKAIKTGADIVGVDFWRIYENKKVYEKDDISKPRNILLGEVLKVKHCSRCNKLIKHSLIKKKQIAYVNGINYGEDYIFMLQCFHWADKIEYISHPLYNYIQYNTQSICHKPMNEEHLNGFQHMIDFTANFINTNHIMGYDYELAYTKLKIKNICMMNAMAEQRKKYSQLYPEANRYKYRFFKEWRKKVSIYQMITFYFPFFNLSHLSNVIHKLQNKLKNIK